MAGQAGQSALRPSARQQGAKMRARPGQADAPRGHAPYDRAFDKALYDDLRDQRPRAGAGPGHRQGNAAAGGKSSDRRRDKRSGLAASAQQDRGDRAQPAQDWQQRQRLNDIAEWRFVEHVAQLTSHRVDQQRYCRADAHRAHQRRRKMPVIEFDAGERRCCGFDEKRLGDGDTAQRHGKDAVTARPDDRRQHQEEPKPAGMSYDRLDQPAPSAVMGSWNDR